MPVYFTLQEALSASQTASKDYNPRMKGGREGKAIMVQKPEIKPPIVEPIIEPIKTEPDPEPEKDPRIELEEKIREARRKLAGVRTDISSPDVDVFREPPLMVKGLAVDLIDPAFTKSQIVKGASKVQQLYGEQNQTKPITKLISKTKSKVLKVAEQGLINTPVNLLRHPIVSLQNSFLRDPIENRDMLFSIAVNEIVQKSIFPDNPELALTLPEEFIKNILEEGKKVRNRNIGVRGFHAVSDLLTSLSPFLDSQQRRALDLLQKKIVDDPQGFLKDIEESNLKYSSDHAQGFALTLTRGDEPIPNQIIFGNSQILLPGETRREVNQSDENDPNIIQTKVKNLIKPYVQDKSTLDNTHKKQLIKEVVEIYKEAGLITDEDLNSGKKVANNILNLVDDLTKNPEDLQHYLAHWQDLKIVTYLAQSTGEAQGGQERFFTTSQEIAFKMHQDKMNVTRGKGLVASVDIESAKSLPKNVVSGLAKTGVYFAGYLASYGIGLAKGVPRTAVGTAIHAGFWPLGPLWSGFYGGMTEAGSDINTKFYKHESNVTRQLRQVSREKTLRKDGADVDIVRSELEEALVTALPASEMTENINGLVLQDQNNWSSETKQDLTPEQITELLINIANAKARLTLSLRSGYKDIKYKTQNWVSYKEGHEQEELTNLKAVNLQAFWRLKSLQEVTPEIFSSIPLFDTNGGDLEKIISCYSSIIQTGLLEGLPIGQLENNPLSNFKSKRFYKQIFEASGMDESQISGVESLLTSFRNNKKTIGGKTMYEWLDESESLKNRTKNLNRLKWTRGITAGASSALTSVAIGEVKHLAEQVIESHQPHPVAPVSNEQTPVPSPTETILTIDLPNIFKSAPNSHTNSISIFDSTTNSIHNVNIPTAQGMELRLDNTGHYDLVKTADNTIIYQDVFVKSHDGFVPNPHFIPDSSHPTIEVNLGQQIHFKTEEQLGIGQESGGSVVNLLDKTENYRIVWGHTGHGNKQPDTDSIFETKGQGHEQHPFGVEIKFKDDTIRNPNNNEVTTLDSHFTDGSMAAMLEIKGIGQVLLKDCFDRGNNPDGSHFYTLKLDPTSTDLVKLADGTTTTIGQIAQTILNQEALKTHPVGPINSDLKVETMNIFNLANPDTNQRGFILFGFTTDGDPKGFTPIPGNNEIFMPVHLVTGTNPIVSPPEIITPPPIIEMLPPQPVEIPVEIPHVVVPEPVIPVPVPITSNFSPLPSLYYSPQLHPTSGETPIPASSTPLPQSVINSNEFKKEKQPDGYDNQQAFNFLSNLSDTLNVQDQIDNFILDNAFNQKQQTFIKSSVATNFFTNDVVPNLQNNNLTVYKKITEENSGQLSNEEKDQLKNTILQQAEAHGISETEALILNSFLIHRSYLSNLRLAILEKKQIEDELNQLQSELSSLPTQNSNPINPPPQKPAVSSNTPNPATELDNHMDDFVNKMLKKFPEAVYDDETQNAINYEISQFIRDEKLLTENEFELAQTIFGDQEKSEKFFSSVTDNKKELEQTTQGQNLTLEEFNNRLKSSLYPIFGKEKTDAAFLFLQKFQEIQSTIDDEYFARVTSQP